MNPYRMKVRASFERRTGKARSDRLLRAALAAFALLPFIGLLFAGHVEPLDLGVATVVLVFVFSSPGPGARSGKLLQH